MPGHGKAIAACVSAIAAAVLVTSSALAASETTSTQKIETPAAATSVAVLSLPTTGANDAGPNVAIDRAVSDTTIVGAASFYDDPGETASGELYDPTAFTAAAQLKIRDKFGGIKFGRLYQPSYGVAEYAGKKLIVKFNDVGPLRPGRKFDLSRAAMKYFDGLELGVLPDVKVTVLPLGLVFTAGPVTDEQLAALGLGGAAIATAGVDPNTEPGSNARQGDVATPIAAVDTQTVPAGFALASAAELSIEGSRECKDAGVAAAQAVHGAIGEFERDGLLALAATPAMASESRDRLTGLQVRAVQDETDDSDETTPDEPSAE